MTNAELIQKIRNEIERRIKHNHCMADNAINSNMRNFYDGEEDCCKQLLSFLDTLESEKPMNQDGLEEEINRLWESFADEMEGPHNLFDIYARLARHFAQWGAEHSGSSEIPNDMEEAADDSWALYEYRESPRGLYSTCYVDGFKAGVEWSFGQGMIREGKIISESGEVGWIEYDTPAPVELMKHFKKGDEIVLQIRKK